MQAYSGEREKATCKSGTWKETEEGMGSGQAVASCKGKAVKDTRVTEESKEGRPLTTNTARSPSNWI